MLDKKLLLAILKGLASFIPGFHFFLRKKRKKNRNSCSIAKFCYSFWLRIVVYCNERSEDIHLNQIGEIGTAGSLGLGMCALLSGSKRYYALDIENMYDLENNLRLFDEIVDLFKNNTPIPADLENLNLKINDYSFPAKHISHLYLNENFISNLRKDLIKCLSFESSDYFYIKQQWQLSSKLDLDFIFSRAVMEHVKYPDEVYVNIARHLKPDGYMLHDIELHSHNLMKSTDGHYYLNRFIWALIFGTRKFLLNRWTLEKHIQSIKKQFILVDKIVNFVSNEVTNSSVRREPYGASILAKNNIIDSFQ